jgi:hypothetical protein
MKTAMQQMAYELDQLPEREQMIWLIRNYDRYIDIEKQQIIDAYQEGFDELTPFIKAKDYYNQTYNQNK